MYGNVQWSFFIASFFRIISMIYQSFNRGSLWHENKNNVTINSLKKCPFRFELDIFFLYLLILTQDSKGQNIDFRNELVNNRGDFFSANTQLLSNGPLVWTTLQTLIVWSGRSCELIQMLQQSDSICLQRIPFHFLISKTLSNTKILCNSLNSHIWRRKVIHQN